MYNYDYLVEYIGLSAYQIVLLLCMSLQVWTSGLNNVAPVFLMATPDYHAKQYWLDILEGRNCAESYTAMQGLNATISWAGLPANRSNSSPVYEQCSLYHFNSQQQRLINGTIKNNHIGCQDIYDNIESIVNDDTLKTIQPQNGYWYAQDKSGMIQTTTTEFNLVCDASSLNKYVKSSYMIGFALGAMVFGNIADNKGRKFVMIITSIGSLIFDVAIVFSVNIWMFALTRMLAGFFLNGLYVAAFTYAVEIVHSKYRSYTGVNIQAQFAIGYILLGLLSGIPLLWNWRYFSAIISFFSFIAVACSFYVPESPAWLMSKDRESEALEICEDMLERKTGETVFPDYVLRSAQKQNTNKYTGETYTMISLFKHRSMAVITINIMIQWFVNTMTYYGLLFGAGDLPGSVIFNNTMGGVMEILSQVVLISLMDRAWCGRRKLLISLELSAGITCLACAVMYYPAVNIKMIDSGITQENIDFYIKISAMIGKFGIAGSFALMYNYTAELYPVMLRSNGVAIGSIAGRIGGVLFPIILDLKLIVSGGNGDWLPMAIFGALVLFATVLSFTLPETCGVNNLTSIHEALKLYSGELSNDSNDNKDEELCSLTK